MLSRVRKHISPRAFIVIITILVLIMVYLLFRSSSLTFSAKSEAEAMERLNRTKESTELSLFVSDGCSGSVSSGWTAVIESLSSISERFSSSYADAQTIPFEAACIEHDRAYHAGEGGYVGRLKADMQLRADIVDYAIENTDEIKERTGIDSDERAIHLYELVARGVYQGVRIGGAPCTGKAYAWGYGYRAGECVE